MNFKSIIVTVLSKLQFLDEDNDLVLENMMLWIFLLITAFRALFANVTISYGANFKWTIPDIPLAATLPILFSLLSTAHQNYLAAKNQGANNNVQN